MEFFVSCFEMGQVNQFVMNQGQSPFVHVMKT